MITMVGYVLLGMVPVLILRYYIIDKRMGLMGAIGLGVLLAFIANVTLQILGFHLYEVGRISGLIGGLSILFFYSKWLDPGNNYSQDKQEDAFSEESINQQMKSADKYLKEGDYSSAKKLYLFVLRKDWTNAKVHYSLMETCSRLEDKGAALFHLKKAIEFGLDDETILRDNNNLEWLRKQPEYLDIIKQITKIQSTEDSINKNR